MNASVKFPRKRVATVADREAPIAGTSHFSLALNDIESWTGELHLKSRPKEVQPGNLFTPGTVFFGKLRPYLAKIWVSDRTGVYIGDFIPVRPRYDIDPEFLSYVFRTEDFIHRATAESYGSKMPRIEWDRFKNLRVPLPPYSTQREIVGFLDRETAEIDAFIADQERLIELLEERRAATITHAVTKGLDPTVPMKDSGFEWLGRVPSSWRIHAIKLGTDMSGGTGFPHQYQGVTDEVVAFHKVSALGTADADGIVREKRDTVSHATANELGATVFPAGSIVLAKIGAALLLGRIRLVEHSFCIDNNMLAVTSQGQTDIRFLYYALQIIDFSQIVNPGAVPSLDMTAFRDYKLAFPSREEQSNIAEFLDRETAEIDAAVSDAREAIALSRERRGALISAAVTGQLDVSQHDRPLVGSRGNEVRV